MVSIVYWYAREFVALTVTDRNRLDTPIDILVKRCYTMGMNTSKQKVWTILSTPTNVDFKKFREEHDTIWLTKERDYLYIQDMTTDHIISCINMLERNSQEYTRAYDGLIKELKRRYRDGEEWRGLDEN